MTLYYNTRGWEFGSEKVLPILHYNLLHIVLEKCIVCSLMIGNALQVCLHNSSSLPVLFIHLHANLFSDSHSIDNGRHGGKGISAITPS